MVEVFERAHAPPFVAAFFLLALVGFLSLVLHAALHSLYFHPLAKFPGPKLAALSTWYKGSLKCFVGRSWTTVLQELHAKYGDVVRVGPNELHFAKPQAYPDIYNNQNRWDKEYHLYHSFGEDRSSFGFLTYKEAKERKDVLSRTFSQAAVGQTQGLIVDKIESLCRVIDSKAESIDLNYAFRCLTMDVITYLSFGQSVDAIVAPDFKAPILLAMDASMPVFNYFQHMEWYKNMIMNCPPKLSKIISPATAGLVDLQLLLKDQIARYSGDPDSIEYLPHNMTIYHSLMSKESYKSGIVPVPGSIYEEAQALMFAGADTSGNTLMVIMHHLLQQPDTYQALKAELIQAWPSLNDEPPGGRELERLPLLNACIKEGLRMSNGVVAGLLRVVPPQGAKIADVDVPGGTVVSCSAPFVHNDPSLFPAPSSFTPRRWLDSANPRLDDWLVAFSKGPRSCLGINLAWMELRLTLAHVLRKYDVQIDESSPGSMEYKDTFLPWYHGQHVRAKMTRVH